MSAAFGSSPHDMKLEQTFEALRAVRDVDTNHRGESRPELCTAAAAAGAAAGASPVTAELA
jgi:hypothetical protein